MELLFHPATKKSIDNFTASPSHAVLISGPIGSGKGTIATYIAGTLLHQNPNNISELPQVLRLSDLEKGISIDNIRTLQTFLQLKTPGKNQFRRALIIEQGETMSLEAQNAFLKILEEPPSDTVIIITCSSQESLLPTIRSRSQVLSILPVPYPIILACYKDLYSESQIKKAYFTSEGYAGLMHALLEFDTDHPLLEQITIAKSLLSSSSYERLLRVDELSKQKNIEVLLYALERICHASLAQSIQSGKDNIEQWTRRLKVVVESERRYRQKPQAKLFLTDLMLTI